MRAVDVSGAIDHMLSVVLAKARTHCPGRLLLRYALATASRNDCGLW
ncbi:hypothetical protein Bra471DRAFT_02935 [Bradyrhizobium sp. WSM471]|nr:hypothetical protein Bra471DRAFT_02935 [Bradyrhizobium sp. WSM471]